MKRTIVAAAAIASIALGGCKKSEPQAPSTGSQSAPATAQKAQQAPAAPAGPKLVPLDLGTAGLAGVTIQAPEGATAKASFGDAEIAVGGKSLMQVHPTETDLEAYKKAVQENDVNKLKAFVVEGPDALVYESEAMGRSEFHFIANVRAGDASWSCEDVKGPAHTRADVELALRMCRSLSRK